MCSGGDVMIFEMEDCGGCRTCELACSYHHNGSFFRPYISSIKIIKKENEPGYVIKLEEETAGNVIACDGCVGLTEPLCVEYCEKKDEMADIIKQFMEKQDHKSSSGK